MYNSHFMSHRGHIMFVMVTLSMIWSLLLFQVPCHMVTINVDMVTFSNIMDIILMLWLLILKKYMQFVIWSLILFIWSLFETSWSLYWYYGHLFFRMLKFGKNNRL